MPSTALTALFLLAAWDMRFRRLPNSLVAILVLVSIVSLRDAEPAILAARTASASIWFGVFFVINERFSTNESRPSLGMGDAKLIAAISLLLPAKEVSEIVLFACGLGFLWIAYQCLWKNECIGNVRSPLGAFLCVGAAITLGV